ncbi:MAG: hypothetical protein GY725_12020 [bacterium]|nr:hypothetical protein [bacterium]
MQMIRAVLLATVVAVSCSSENLADWNEPGVLSPEGWAKARVLEFELDHDPPHSQVYVTFDRGKCGGGSYSASGVGLDLTLQWLDAETLEVSHPAHVQFDSIPSGAQLQCLNRKVRVVLAPR